VLILGGAWNVLYNGDSMLATYNIIYNALIVLFFDGVAGLIEILTVFGVMIVVIYAMVKGKLPPNLPFDDMIKFLVLVTIMALVHHAPALTSVSR
jgi:hypothetical protein